MARRSAFLRSIAVFAMVFVLASCDSSKPEGDSPLSPSAKPQAGLVTDALQLLKPPPQSAELKLVTEPALLGDLDLSKLISLSGGTISVAGITLTVPAGALSGPTLFTVAALPTAVVDVSLTATVTNLLGVLDVGSIGFKKPVTITMSYARATNIENPSRLVIVYYDYRQNKLVPLKTTVNTSAKTISAQVDHFSKYGMAEN